MKRLKKKDEEEVPWVQKKQILWESILKGSVEKYAEALEPKTAQFATKFVQENVRS